LDRDFFHEAPAMSESDDRLLAPRVRIMQIIAFALITGVLVFLGFACFQVFVQRQGEPAAPIDGLPMISLVTVAVFAGGVVASFVVPTVMTRAALQRIAAGTRQVPQGTDPKDQATDLDKLLAVKQTALIVGMALLEGPAFMGCIAFFIEAQFFTLGIVAVAIVAMLLRFPTEGGVRNWLYEQTNQLQQIRQSGQRPSELR
jgi:hypothetical protein